MRVDRQKTTPLLIRIFAQHGDFNKLSEFDAQEQPRNELNLYTWKDATLGELSNHLAKELIDDAEVPITSYKFGYRLIYADTYKNRYASRDLGTVQVSQASRDARYTLDELDFQIGDWLAVAVLRPGDRLHSEGRRDRERPHEQGSGYNRSNKYNDKNGGSGDYRYNRNGDRGRTWRSDASPGRRSPRPREYRRGSGNEYR